MVINVLNVSLVSEKKRQKKCWSCISTASYTNFNSFLFKHKNGIKYHQNLIKYGTKLGFRDIKIIIFGEQYKTYKTLFWTGTPKLIMERLLKNLSHFDHVLKLQSNCVSITLRYRCFHVNLLHIFRTLFLENTSGRLLLDYIYWLSF